MSGKPDEKPFRRRAFFDGPDLVGARWWQEGLMAHVNPVTRRRALRQIVLVVGGVGAAGLAIALLTRRGYQAPHDPDLDRDSLELQKEQGWDVGQSGAPLELPSKSPVDVAASAEWNQSLPELAAALSPSTRLAPFYVPTLFQSLTPPSSAGLRQSIAPIHDEAMDAAYARGEALAALFTVDDAPDATAVLIDVPGPIAVAVAAGMAERFEPVFLFDNWPHPVGVVPAHLTLAAAIFYRPRFVAAAAERKPSAPPVFVADDQRLNPYIDAGDRFDNRYLLRLPAAAQLTSLGIKRLLYVRPQGGQVELDDLNDDFVALAKEGIAVKIVSLDDFRAAAEETPPPATAPTTSTTTSTTHRHYYWGGHPGLGLYFWPTYGWSRALAPRYPPPGLRPPVSIGTGAAYQPTPRPTMFSSRTVGGPTGGVGRQRPTGFGRVSFRSSGGRNGSWGRSTSSSGG